MQLDVWISQPIGVHGFQSLWTQTDTQTHKYYRVKGDVMMPSNYSHATVRVRKRQHVRRTCSTAVTSQYFFWRFSLSRLVFSTSFVMSSRELFSEICIIDIMGVRAARNGRLVSLHDDQNVSARAT